MIAKLGEQFEKNFENKKKSYQNCIEKKGRNCLDSIQLKDFRRFWFFSRLSRRTIEQFTMDYQNDFDSAISAN
ncbi:hypothetical protein QR98_0078370 [Sarcoptes scabiei]|uniref:Uncharacterized protein n=1 Tax=Sarcoptes scabiei TaxID=52283 RepID=A0A132AED6_SARSC|nr:hypothetical protein QR98_0078370 [Sarcoptes scabiei]